ncbi:hypothetical protein AHAS_Ahas15G0337600 [Arachis hypogaea]
MGFLNNNQPQLGFEPGAPPSKANIIATQPIYQKQTGEGALAVVVRDRTGRIITETTEKIKVSSSLVAEAHAVRRALILAKNLQIEQIIIKSDSLTLVQAVKSKARIGEIEPILKDIQWLTAKIPKSGFTWIPREGNFLAHQVAKKCLADELSADWTWNLKGDLKQIAFLETRGLSSWQVNFENGRSPQVMQCLAAQEEREQTTSFRPGDKREASLKLDGETSSTETTMEENAMGIAAIISEELVATDTNRRRLFQCRHVRASSDHGDAGYDGVAGGNGSGSDRGKDGKYHDTCTGEVAVNENNIGDGNVASNGNEIDDCDVMGGDLVVAHHKEDKDYNLNCIRVF